MTGVTVDLRRQLRQELRHRIRPMTGRDPDQRDRRTTPLELLYDLVYVIAFGAAAEQLADHLGEVGGQQLVGADRLHAGIGIADLHHAGPHPHAAGQQAGGKRDPGGHTAEGRAPD